MKIETTSRTIRRSKEHIEKRSSKSGVTKMEDPASVLFVKRTPGGTLVNQLRREEEKLWPVLGHRVKLVEKCGKKLKSLLWRADPWGGVTCMDLSCPLCSEDGDKPVCKVSNAIYSNTCKVCKKEGKSAQYIGETSRTLLERSKEHVRDRGDHKKTSHMREHASEYHPWEEVQYKFDLLRSCSTPLERQVCESVTIKLLKREGVQIINSKTEYNRCVLPTIVVTGGEESKKRKDNRKKMMI